MTENDEQYDDLAEAYIRLTREARELVKSAKLAYENKATVSITALNRLNRELRGEPQPSMAWMSPT